VPTLTPAFAAFADAARRYAAFAAAGDGERAGVALALNELADISEGDWDALASAGRRRLAMPFAQQHRRATGAIPAGRLDWREKGYAPAEVPSLAWGRYAAAAGGRGVAGVIDLSGPAGAVPLSGTAAAKAACLDALYQRAAGPRARLPRGGFAHLAASDARLRDALEAERRPAPPGATAGAFVTGPLGYGARHSPAARRARRFVPSPGFFGPAGERDRSEARAAGAGADTGASAEEVEAAEETERAGAALAWLEGAGVEFVAVPFGDEVALHAALASHGPLVVALDASDAILQVSLSPRAPAHPRPTGARLTRLNCRQFYRGGVYAPRAADRACAPRSPTHAFLLLGYDDAAEAPPPPGDAATAAAHWILQSFWYPRARPPAHACAASRAGR
jgi:hypothetical protein